MLTRLKESLWTWTGCLNAHFEPDSTEAMLRSGDIAQGVAANDNFPRITTSNNNRKIAVL